MAEGHPEPAPGSADDAQPGYEIVIVLPLGDGLTVASARGPDDIAALPRVPVDGEPETSSIIAAVARFLDEPHAAAPADRSPDGSPYPTRARPRRARAPSGATRNGGAAARRPDVADADAISHRVRGAGARAAVPRPLAGRAGRHGGRSRSTAVVATRLAGSCVRLDGGSPGCDRQPASRRPADPRVVGPV